MNSDTTPQDDYRLDDETTLEDQATPEHVDLRPVHPRNRSARKLAIGASLVASVLIGGAAVAGSFAGPTAVNAQSSTATASTSSTASCSPTSTSAPTRPGDMGGGLGPNHEAVSDTSVAAAAIGIRESDLRAALAKGQTIAAVAKAHSVAPQKVIDALVTDGLNELATAVKNGTLTQAQADAQKAAVTQRATDQVNGTFTMPGH